MRLAIARPVASVSSFMYFVRTVCELIRTQREKDASTAKHVVIVRALAVFCEGLETIDKGPDSSFAQCAGEGSPVDAAEATSCTAGLDSDEDPMVSSVEGDACSPT